MPGSITACGEAVKHGRRSTSGGLSSGSGLKGTPLNDSNVYATPKSALVENVSSTGVFGHRKYVIYQDQTAWPDRCYRCNSEHVSHKKTKITHINPWLYLSLLISPLALAIVMVIFRKRFTLQLPVCDFHLKRRKRFVMGQWILLIVIMALFAVAVPAKNGVLLVLALITSLVLMVTALFGRMVFIARYRDGNLWVKGAGKAFIASLPSYTGN